MANISSSNSLGERVPKLRFPGFEGGWEEKCFSDLADGFEYGMNSAACEFDGLNRYIRITDIDDNTHEYIDSCPVSPDGEMNEKYIVKEHDILFARTGASTGKTYLYNKKDGILYFAGFLIRANINAFNDSYFVFNLTLTNKYNNWVKLMSMRSGQPGINAMEYSTYKVFVPQIAEQHKIASFLLLLDKKIKLQRQLIEFLKLYKRGLLSKLFPQKGESVPQYRFTEFTDAWEQRKVKEIAPLQRGFDLPTSQIEEGVYPVVMSNGIGGYHSQHKVKGPGIVTGRSGTIGKLHYIEDDYWPHNTTLWVTNFYGNNQKFVYYMYQCMDLSHFSTGSGVPTLNRNDVHDGIVCIPSTSEQKKISDYLTTLDHLITLHQRKCNEMQSIKKFMLQNMFV